jgi:microcystin-dependent protein
MALVESNTYIEPTAGTALNSARTQFNNSMRSLLTNFRSSSPPATVNITASGDGISVPDGTIMHFANANVNALFISDSTTKKSSHIGGNFTRVGIGHRIENGIVPLMSNVSHYDIGELIATVSENGTLAANSRVYLKTSNNANDAAIFDIGTPGVGQVVNTMIAIGGVTSDRTNLSTSGVTTNNLAVFATTAGGGKKWFPEATGVGHAALKISSLGASDNSAIMFNYGSSSANVSLAHQPGLASSKNGLGVVQQDGTYAPMAANVILQSAITGSGTAPVPLIPVGTIVAYGLSTNPDGWLHCNGQSLLRATYPALYAVIGVLYGAGNDAGNTFAAPELRDKMLMGSGTNNGTHGNGAGAFASGGTITTASGSAALTVATGSASTGVKDAGGLTVVTGVSAGGHTHTAVVPHAVARFIIKA